MKKSYLDFTESMKVIHYSIKGYKEGHIYCYRPIAVELRKLLCEKKPLILKIDPEFKLHKLHITKLYEHATLSKDLVFTMAGCLQCNGDGTSSFSLKFANPPILMSLQDWLDQSFMSKSITIREMIKSVADKEAAHSDNNYNNTLKFSKGIKYVNEDSHTQTIVAIGEYVSKLINRTIINK